jgi:hypothetical protein
VLTISDLKKALDGMVARLNEQDSKIQRVSALLEFSKTAPQAVVIGGRRLSILRDQGLLWHRLGRSRSTSYAKVERVVPNALPESPRI